MRRGVQEKKKPISQVSFFIISFPKNNPKEVLITPFKNLLKLLGRAGPSPPCWFAASLQRDGGVSVAFQKNYCSTLIKNSRIAVWDNMQARLSSAGDRSRWFSTPPASRIHLKPSELAGRVHYRTDCLCVPCDPLAFADS